jgi:glycerol kinase
MSILAVDAGTTGVTAQIIGTDGEPLGRGYLEFEQHFPQPGWVEHNPEQIWQATLSAVADALKAAGLEPSDIAAIGITNQRETVAVWDRTTLAAPTNAIVWQDRRTASLLNHPKFAEAAAWVRERTGLPLDPYFSSSKLLWMKQNLTEVWTGIESGAYAVGTIDSYLTARITGGSSHITDASNASRTQLFNIRRLEWDEDLLELFEVPLGALPRVVNNTGHLADSSPEAFLGISAPITGMAGDQQAALFGQLAFTDGQAKCTYGTGAFLLLNTGKHIVNADSKLIATVAWVDAAGEPTYALEGSVFTAGAAVQWLRDGLGIIERTADVEALAASVPDSGGVSFVPALTGLGAPVWNPNATGLIHGITRGTTKAHIARATLEGIAHQVTSVFGAMTKAADFDIRELRVDGGASANNLLMQIQATQLQIAVERPQVLESTALGAVFLAGLGAGIWKSLGALEDFNPTSQRFAPGKPNPEADARWLTALEMQQ